MEADSDSDGVNYVPRTPLYPLEHPHDFPDRSQTPTTEECGNWTLPDDDLDSRTLQQLVLTVLFPLGLALAASIKVDLFSFVHFLSFIYHFASPVHLFHCGERVHVPHRPLLRINFVTAVCGVLVQMMWQVVLLIPTIEVEYNAFPDIFIDLGLPRYTLFFAVVAREVLPSIVLATICAKCLGLVQMLLQQPQPSRPSLGSQQDFRSTMRLVCAVLCVMVGLSRPSAIGCTFLTVGIAYNMAWAHTADRGGACFSRLASVGVRYTGLLLALEYLTHSRSISSHLLVSQPTLGRRAALLGLDAEQGVDYILHEALLLLLFLMLYYYRNYCEGEPRPQTLDPSVQAMEDSQNEELVGLMWTPKQAKAAAAPEHSAPDVRAAAADLHRQHRGSSQGSSEPEAELSIMAWNVARLEELAGWCQKNSFVILLCLFLAVALVYPNAFSLAWLSLLLAGLLLPATHFTDLLPGALILSWVALGGFYIANMPLTVPQTPATLLLGLQPSRFPAFALLLLGLLPLFISVCLNGTPILASDSAEAQLQGPWLLPSGLVSARWMVAHHLFKWLTLLLVFWAGLADVSVLNFGFIVFFCAFFIWPRVGSRMWTALLVYVGVSACAVYGFMVFCTAGLVEVTDTWVLLGLVDSVPPDQATQAPNSRWTVFFYLCILISGVAEKSAMRNDAYLYSILPQSNKPGMLVRYYVFRLLCLGSFLYLALYPVNEYGLDGKVTLISFIYLLCFLGCTLLTLARPTAVVVRTAWYVVAVYSGLVMLATYLYQFHQVRVWIERELHQLRVTPAVIGLVDYDKEVGLGLIRWAFVLCLTVYNLSLLRWIVSPQLDKFYSAKDSCITHDSASGSPITRPPALLPLTSSQPCSPKEFGTFSKRDFCSDTWASALSHTSSDIRGEDREQSLSEVMSCLQRFCINYCPLLAQVLLFHAAISYRTVPARYEVEDPSPPRLFNCLAAVYLVVLLLWNLRPRARRYVLCLASVPLVAIAVIYAFQFRSVGDWIGQAASREVLAYIGLAKPLPGTKFRTLLWPHLRLYCTLILTVKSSQWRWALEKGTFLQWYPPHLIFRPRTSVLVVPPDDPSVDLISDVGSGMEPDGPSSSRGPFLRPPQLHSLPSAIPSCTAAEEDWLLTAARFLTDELFVRFGFHCILATVLVEAYSNRHCALGLLYVLLGGWLAFRGKVGMMRKAPWTLVVVLLSLLLLGEYLLMLGLPPGLRVAVDLPCGPDDGCAARPYLMLQPGVPMLWHLFLVVVLIGHYRSHVCRMVDTDAVPHTPSLTALLSDRAASISHARRQLDEASLQALRQLLPPPPRPDFMEPPRSLRGQALAVWFLFTPYVVLYLMFSHSVAGHGDGPDQDGPGLSMLNLAELLIALAMFHSTSDLTWNGNRYWQYIPSLYYALLLACFVLTVPGVHRRVGDSQVLRILGVGRMDPAAPPAAGSEGDCWFLLGLLLLSYVQYLNFDNVSFIFVLQYAQRHAVSVSKRSRSNVHLRHKMMKQLRWKEAQQKKAREQRLADIRQWRQLREEHNLKKSLDRESAPGEAVDRTSSLCKVISRPSVDVVGPPRAADGSSGEEDVLPEPLRKVALSSARSVKLADSRDVILPSYTPSQTATTVTPAAVRGAEAQFRHLSVTSASSTSYHSSSSSADRDVDFPPRLSVVSPNPKATSTSLMAIDSEWMYVDNLEDGIKELLNETRTFLHKMIDGLTAWLLQHSLAMDLGGEVRTPRHARLEHLAYALFQFALSYTDWLCFLAVIYYTIHTPSLFGILLLSTIFCYALLVTPHRFYWEATLFAVEAAVALKAFTLVMRTASQQHTALPVAIAQVCSYSGHGRLLLDMWADLSLLVLIVLHKSMLKWGMWYVSDDTERLPGKGFQDSRPGGRRRGSGVGLLVGNGWHRVRYWLRRRVSMEDKLGKDLYIVEFFFEICFFSTLLFSYYSLVGSDSDLMSSIQANLIPGNLVAWQAFLFLLIVINRMVYLFRSLLGKLVLHYFNTALLLIGCLWWWNTLRHREPLNADFLFRCHLLLILKMLQLACSGQQIKYGYARISGNRLTDEYTDFRHYVYIMFRQIPFVFEMRSILDWTFTKTTLKLWYWLKLEDIHHELLVARADIMDNRYWNRPVGAPYSPWAKCKSGLCFFLMIMIIMFLPLLWYASFSPALTYNYVNATAVQLAFAASPPLYTSEVIVPPEQLNADTVQVGVWIERMRPILQRHTFDEGHSIQLISLEEYSHTLWDISSPARHRLLDQFAAGANISLVLTATMSRVRGFGSPINVVQQHWPIPRELYDHFITAVASVGVPNTTRPPIPLDCFYSPFLFNSPLSIQRYALDVDDPRCGLMTHCQLSFEEDEIVPGRQFSTIQCRALCQRGNGDGVHPPEWAPEEAACMERGDQCPNYNSALDTATHPWVPLYFVVASAKAPFYQGSGYLASVGIMTLYSTFVFTLARLLRWLLTGTAYRVHLEDMEDPSRLIQLVEDIKLARSEGDLLLEEQLYEELIHIYQSTELLKYWSRLEVER